MLQYCPIIFPKIHNPLDTPITVETVQSDASLEGIVYAQFTQDFNGFVIGPGETVNSKIFKNVWLTQGALNSLDIIGVGYLDVKAAATVRVGDNGYIIPWLKLNQDRVPASYDLDLGFAAAKKIAASAALEGSTTLTSSMTEAVTTTSRTVEASTSEATTTTTAAPVPTESSAEKPELSKAPSMAVG